MNYNDYLEELEKELIKGDNNDGFLVRMTYEKFDKAEYERLRDKFVLLNEAATKNELSPEQLLKILELSHLFYSEILSFYSKNDSKEYADIVFDSENLFGYDYEA